MGAAIICARRSSPAPPAFTASIRALWEDCLMFRLANEKRNGYADGCRVMVCPFTDQGTPTGLFLVRRIAGADA